MKPPQLQGPLRVLECHGGFVTWCAVTAVVVYVGWWN